MPAVKPPLAAIGPAIKALAVLAALLPSAAVLLGVFEIPPSLKQFLTLIVTVLGLLCTAIVIVLRGPIARLSNARAVAIFVPIVGLGCVASVGYYEFARTFVIHFDKDPIILPLRYEPRVAEIIYSGFHGDVEQALMNSTSRYFILHSIEQTNDSATLVLILLLSASEILLVIGLLGAIVAVAADLPSPVATAIRETPPPNPDVGSSRPPAE